MIFRRGRFADVVARQLDVFAEDEAHGLLEEVRDAKGVYDRAEREEAEETVRRLRRRRRGRDRGARRHALAVREHARRGGRRGVRGGLQPSGAQALAATRPRDRESVAMARIEDYALIGDLQTAALVERGGSVDWLCFPRFDSGACFAALLGEPEQRPLAARARRRRHDRRRRYLHDTLVLETTWETTDGIVRVFDFMPPRGRRPTSCASSRASSG